MATTPKQKEQKRAYFHQHRIEIMARRKELKNRVVDIDIRNLLEQTNPLDRPLIRFSEQERHRLLISHQRRTPLQVRQNINPPQRKEYMRAYRLRHPEIASRYNEQSKLLKRRYNENPVRKERIKAYKHQYYLLHKRVA